MSGKFSRRVSRRRRRVFRIAGPEQLETRQLLTQISGFVFHDTDADGDLDSNETGIPGVLVTLTGTTDEGDQVTRRFLTQFDGSYEFGDLAAGTYAVEEQQPSAIADGLDRTEADGVVTGDDSYSEITIGDDEVAGLNFGEGTIDAQHISPLWLLASSSRESFRREMRASIETDAGNSEIADAILEEATELDADFELNELPEATEDSYSVDSGETLTVSVEEGVLNNDTDPEGADLTASAVDQPENGTLTLAPDGSFTFEPDSGFIGEDSFTYVANDGFKDSEATTVTIQVGNPNTFTVSETSLEDDVIGTIQPLTDIGEDVVFEFADLTSDEDFRLAPDDHTSGLPEAPVTIIEYLDFACPACRNFHESAAAERLSLEPGEFFTIYRYNPLSNFTANHNLEAAQAAEAASRQGRFISMMDQLFDNFDEWRGAADADAAIALFEQYASEISGINLTQFRSDFADPTVIERIERDQAVAQAQTPQFGTPTFIVNGELFDGIVGDDDLIDASTEARREPFKLNRLATDAEVSGELSVLNTVALAEGVPETFQIVATGSLGSEVIDVTVNVTA
ncbi:MAG: thioredoxin domain-containing protein [Planctomycetaceae bacterium]